MGINRHAFSFIRKVSYEKNFSDTLTIGRQKITADSSVINQITKENKIKSKYLNEYLINYFGSNKVDVMDINNYEGANIIHDLNTPIPKNLEEQYDTIIDAGSLEHIFDIKTALQNLTKLCKPNGTIIHISPSNNFCGHGFYQFSPNIFHSFYSDKQNFGGTEIFLAKVFNSKYWFKIKRENYKNNQRINIITDEETFVLCKTKKINNDQKDFVQQDDYSEEFYNKKKIKDPIKIEVQNKKDNLGQFVKKIGNLIPFLKKIYNFFRKYKEYKYNRLNSLNKNIQIINVNSYLEKNREK
jgi:hypothetical protein